MAAAGRSAGHQFCPAANSGKRAESNRQRLVKLGVPRDHFIDAVSSGEVAFSGLTAKRAFLIGKDGEDYGFDGITFGATTLSTAAVTLDSNGGNLAFTSTVDGAQDFTVTAGAGNITFNGVVGGGTRLGNVTINSAANVTATTLSAATLTRSAGTGTTAPINTGPATAAPAVPAPLAAPGVPATPAAAVLGAAIRLNRPGTLP